MAFEWNPWDMSFVVSRVGARPVFGDPNSQTQGGSPFLFHVRCMVPVGFKGRQ